VAKLAMLGGEKSVTTPFIQWPVLDQPGAETCCRETVWISQNQLLGGPEHGQSVADAIHKVLENADELRI
jgi:hypothetical protein